MDPVVSTVSLEDDVPSSGVVVGANPLDANPLDMRSVGGVHLDATPVPSGQSSVVCSSPADGSRSQSTAPGEGNATSTGYGKEGNEDMIRDVIDQLERQCSTVNEISGIGQASINVENITKGLPSGVDTSPTALTQELAPSTRASGGGTGNMKVPENVWHDSAHCLWIPSARTREALASLPGTGDGRVSYTMPGIMIEQSLGDPVIDALQKHCDDHPSLSSVTRGQQSAAAQVNIPSLLELVDCGNFRAAINLTGKLLSISGQGMGKANQPSKNTEETLKIWCLRLHLLVAIGQHKLASPEMETFGDLDAPDLYYDYYPDTYAGRKGSMVPFSMRLLHAELPRFIGQHEESLLRLNRILAVIKRIMKELNDGTEDETSSALLLWNQRQRKAQYALARCFLGMKEFRLAAIVYGEMIGGYDGSHESLSGRVSLMLGSLNDAKEQFQLFQATGDDARSKCWAMMHNGYVCVANNEFADALVAFQKAAKCDPTNVYAINNAAICFLYLGRLDDAVNTLEKAVQDTRQPALEEGTCMNLCTLYELQSTRSAQRKVALLKSVYQQKGDGFNVACLKLLA